MPYYISFKKSKKFETDLLQLNALLSAIWVNCMGINDQQTKQINKNHAQ